MSLTRPFDYHVTCLYGNDYLMCFSDSFGIFYIIGVVSRFSLFLEILIGREQEARALIGQEVFRGTNQHTDRMHDSQWEDCILLSVKG